MTHFNDYVLTVSEAGRRYFGLSKSRAYVAAERGDIPTIRIGKRIFVPIAAIEAMIARASQPKSEAGSAAGDVGEKGGPTMDDRLGERLARIEATLERMAKMIGQCTVAADRSIATAARLATQEEIVGELIGSRRDFQETVADIREREHRPPGLRSPALSR